MTRVKKNSLFIVFSFVLIAILAVGLVFTMIKVENQITTKTISTSAYEVGGIDESTGKNKETTASIRTKDFFEVDGFKCEIDEDASITYKVFFYDKDQKLLTSDGVSDVQSGNYSTVPSNAVYFRIEITPSSNLGEVTISAMNVTSYARQLTVTVNK